LSGWVAATALASRTSQPTIGLLVTPVAFWNVGVLAKLAATLDHVSAGRAILGMGAGWLEAEYRAFDIAFGDSAGDRLARLAEVVPLVRRLLDGETLDHQGAHVGLAAAYQAPPPLQSPLPILIGGEGRRRTLPIVAAHADLWNARGSIDDLRAADSRLRELCAETGRDADAIERTTNRWVTIRDHASDAQRVLADSLSHHGIERYDSSIVTSGPPASIAAELQPLLDAGFSHIIWSLRAPWDHQTIDRMPEVRRLLEAT
jgi:alkanesulfonate monooxygenase SsuD/methylene tetrahydromethanopterin reductase-like flavin-dependent oxidoreductase (luciferase family)